MDPALPSELVRQFEPLGALGRGAMGLVLRARERVSGREVALKLALNAATPERLARFAREGSLTASLDHPGIVRVHQAGVADGRPFLVYELVVGARTLGQAFAGASRERRIALVLDVARALGHAHAHGVVHRDLKPDNVLVDADGRVRVTDFGLATANDLERLTQTGAVVGTPLFMAPEQFGGTADESRSPRIDVWALGVVLYQALTGQLPFEDANNLFLLSARIAGADFRRPRAIDPTVPVPLDALVVWALSPDPRRRPADGAAFAAALEGAVRGEMPGPTRRRAGVGVLAVALLSLGAATTIALRLPGAAEPVPAPLLATSPVVAPVVVAITTTSVSARQPEWGQPGPDGRLLLPPPAQGEDLSLSILRDNAERGELSALVSLGRRLVEATGARKDVEGGVALLRVAAGRGDVDVMVWLGDAFVEGALVAADVDEAWRWYEQAVAKGDPRAPTSLARLALVRGDLALARVLCARAAAFGELKRVSELGNDLAQGTGVPADLDLALWLCSVAGDRGYARASKRAGDLLRSGTPRRAPDLVRARRYYLAAAVSGASEGAEELGEMQLQGAGGPRDPVAAVRWLRFAAEEGKAQAQRALGLLLADGAEGVPPAPAEAARWLELRVGERAVAHRLARLLWYGGEGLPRDCPRALQLLLEQGRVRDGDLATYYETGRWLLEGGPGVPPDPKLAELRFAHAANRGHPGAMVELALAGLREGGRTRRWEARGWLERAAAAGDARAIAELEQRGWALPDGVAPVESR